MNISKIPAKDLKTITQDEWDRLQEFEESEEDAKIASMNAIGDECDEVATKLEQLLEDLESLQMQGRLKFSYTDLVAMHITADDLYMIAEQLQDK